MISMTPRVCAKKIEKEEEEKYRDGFFLIVKLRH